MVNYVEKVKNKIKIETALVSVSDKTNLDFLVRELLNLNQFLLFISTGGTHKAIKETMRTMPQYYAMPPYEEANLMSVEEYTGYPEMQGGLVKTLHPKIHAGLLAEEFSGEHATYLTSIDAKPIDLVVCNLYPFKETVAEKDVTPEKARANIDIGGPTMIRAAAKNYHRVTVITNPEDYLELINELSENGGDTTLRFRFDMHKKAFQHTAKYDEAIMKYNKKLKFKHVESTYKVED